MKDFLCYWIVFQLLAIGFAGGILHDKIKKGTYICVNSINDEKSSLWATMFVPLIFFVAESEEVTDYCEVQKNKIGVK